MAKMIDYVKNTDASHFLLLTECSMGDNIIAENPERNILRTCRVRCPHMSQITLEDTLAALREDKYPVEVDQAIRVKALASVERMFEMS